MIGIRHFKAAIGICLGSSWIACAAADEIAMAGESRLTGAVKAIAENGSITLASPLSTEPLVLRGDAVQRVEFSRHGEPGVRGDTLLTLVNGDVLPCEVRTLDASSMTLTTSFAGDLSVPRGKVERLDLGMKPSRAIYEGPGSIDGWEAERWTYHEQAFSSQGPGSISRNFELPRQFVLRFKLAWRNHPNLQVAFAESQGRPRGDRYVFQFTSAGIELKRQNQTEQKSVTLISLNRPSEQFAKPEMDVEIRVDREDSKLHLLINGEMQGRIDDPLSSAPSGGGLAFRSSAGGEGTHQISKIQVLSWDSVGDRHRREERGDPKIDALIDREGARYSGQLETIRTGAQGTSLWFKSPLLDQPMQIPAKEVATVFFARTEPFNPAAAPMVLKLHGGGHLHVERCTFSEERISIRHPLLGDLDLNRAALLTVERPAFQPRPEGK